MVKISEIHFNHDKISANRDALNIRQNQRPGTFIESPEWRDGYPSQPAAYAVRDLADEVIIKALFSLQGYKEASLKIRAVDAYNPQTNTNYFFRIVLCLIYQIFKIDFGSVMGGVEEKEIEFDSEGTSKLEEFKLTNHHFKQVGVGIQTIAWKWQYRNNGKWIDFATTKHKIYLVLHEPVAPWQSNIRTAQGKDNTQLPWIDALEIACRWSKGAKDVYEASRMITRRLNGNPQLSYTPETNFSRKTYFLSSFIRQLNQGLTFNLNCTDCANAISILSNLLGANLWAGHIFPNPDNPPLITRDILPIGDNNWSVWLWRYHEVGWVDVVAETSVLYDGCLQIDMNTNNRTRLRKPELPSGIPFQGRDPYNYKSRLFTNKDLVLDPKGLRLPFQ